MSFRQNRQACVQTPSNFAIEYRKQWRQLIDIAWKFKREKNANKSTNFLFGFLMKKLSKVTTEQFVFSMGNFRGVSFVSDKKEIPQNVTYSDPPPS